MLHILIHIGNFFKILFRNVWKCEYYFVTRQKERKLFPEFPSTITGSEKLIQVTLPLKILIM